MHYIFHFKLTFSFFAVFICAADCVSGLLGCPEPDVRQKIYEALHDKFSLTTPEIACVQTSPENTIKYHRHRSHLGKVFIFAS